MSDEEKNNPEKQNKEDFLSGELYGTELMYKTLFNNTPDIISLILFENNFPTYFVDVNQTGIDRMGYSHREFSKLTVADVMAPDALGDIPDKVSEIIKDGKSYFETVLITKDGEEIPVETNNSLFKMDGKDVILSISRDISERKLAEKALKEMEKIYHLISENTSDVIWIQDLESNTLTYVSPSIYNLLGFKAEELLNKSPLDVMDPEGFHLIAANMTQRIEALKSGDESQRTKTEIREYITRDGSTVQAEEITSLLTNEKGQVSQILGVTRDISERMEAEEALRKSEEFNRSIVESSPDCIKVLDLDGKLLMMSEGGQKIMDVDDVNSILNTNLIDFYTEEFRPGARRAIASARDGATAQFIGYCPTLKGKPKWWEVIVSPMLDADGKPERLSAVSRDITQRKKDEEKLRWNEDRLKMGMDMAKMVYWEYSTEKDIFTFDDQFYALYGTNADEEGGNLLSGTEYIERFVDPSGYEIMANEFAKTFEIDDPEFTGHAAHWMIRADGERRYILVHFKIMYDAKGNKIGTRGVNQDITELKNAEDSLNQSLKDKDMLIKEIHHRVKNNLMIISSLLNLQSNYLKDKESIEIFRESQNRAKSMALIHERLYQSEDLKSIGFKEYITTLANDLYRNYVEDPERVELQLDISDLDIDIDHAIPLGLILNELITNSMKYGFPDDRSGKVFVKFCKEADEYVLRVGDDGIGFPSDVDFKNTNTLGMQLVNGLSQQVDGDLELNTDNGTEFIIRFKEKMIGK